MEERKNYCVSLPISLITALKHIAAEESRETKKNVPYSKVLERAVSEFLRRRNNG